ncbi:LON peptidase substrate-binding domain-containing protein [Halothiobacillus neapolitanus]|uniref:LON peptidase substrate-binding domain-containing protein n=1 Tax=Halothiobacillus neapolitanus TaxID=927 RepID=UPI0010609203|nr:LON peptidase substrate-binding domain-containing protein [Halothiobacillus neapolitanus]TDN60881.1 hypothetical protein C8D83_10312 [Halothiobacillus neapolitanus]
MKDVTLLPLFPLHTVLFPGGHLPLRIFETRYIDMVRTCLREGRPFGVVLLKQGSEVRQSDDDLSEFYDVGAGAVIVDTDLGTDGMLHIETQGQGRFRVLRSWSERDGLFRAEVEWLPEATIVTRSNADERLRDFLLRIMEDAAPLIRMPFSMTRFGWCIACSNACPLSWKTVSGYLAQSDST